LLTVADTEAILSISVWLTGAVPCSVNGIAISNSPPNPVDDAVLENHAAEGTLMSIVNEVVPSVNPLAAVNVTLRVLRLRVVE
jgi:hypothetical protein